MNSEPDLNDPQKLFNACIEMGDGMAQQAECAEIGGALGETPYRSFYYGRAAHVLKSAAAFVAKYIPPEPEKKPETEEPAKNQEQPKQPQKQR